MIRVVSDPEPVPITTSLDAVLRSLRGGDRRKVGGIFGAWDDAVGPQVAAHARPIRLDEGVLVVEVDEPAWATQLTFLSDTVRARLTEVSGVTLERLEIRVARRR